MKFINLLILLLGCGFVQAQELEKEVVVADFIVKFGSQLYGNTLYADGLVGELSFAAEKSLTPQLSLQASAKLSGQAINPNAEAELYSELRYYFNKEALLATGRIVNAEKVLSGSYLALAGSFYHKSTPEGFRSIKDLDYNDGGTVYIRNNFVGLKVGRQLYGAVDFGVRAGVESANFKDVYSASDFAYSIGKTTYFAINSYGNFHLPVAWPGKKVFFKTHCAEVACKSADYPLIKIGLQNVFSFSKAGMFFNPQLGYELPLGKKGWSISANAALYFSRRRLFDISYATSSFESSYTHYLNQSIQFEFNPQLRWYFLYNKDVQKSFSSAKMEGFYLRAERYYTTGSLEVRRQAWSFDRNNETAAGGGFGYQRVLFKRVLMDMHSAYLWPTGQKEYNAKGFKGGMQFYWLM